MHRHFIARHPGRRLFTPNFSRHLAAILLAISAIGIFAGCGFVYPPPAIPDVVKKELFRAGEPIAMVTFAPGRRSGKIVGILHSWPFPHVEAREGIASGVFTYVGDVKVTATSDDDGMPAGAEGTRKIYFHEEDPHVSFANPHAYGLGQPVAVDQMSLSFTFQDNHRVLSMRLISQQTTAQPFTFKGNKIKPPLERSTSESFQGEYSPDYGGYLLGSLNE
jgi:hypothetical protein